MFCIIQADRPLLTSEIECSDPAANAELGTSSVSELLLKSHCPSSGYKTTTTRPAHRKLKLVGPGPNSRPHSMHGFGVEGTAGQRSLDPGFSPHRGASKSGIHGIHTKQAFMKSSGPPLETPGPLKASTQKSVNETMWNQENRSLCVQWARAVGNSLQPREQLTRLHENSTTMVSLTLQNRPVTEGFVCHESGAGWFHLFRCSRHCDKVAGSSGLHM